MGLKFPDVTKPETLDRKYSSKMSRPALNLLKGLLDMDPESRLTASEAIQHEYFDDIRDPADLVVSPHSKPVRPPTN